MAFELVQSNDAAPDLNEAQAFIRSHVYGAESQIRALADALVSPLPTVRGLAMSVAALRDGAGPLFNVHSDTMLSASIERIIDTLNPSLRSPITKRRPGASDRLWSTTQKPCIDSEFALRSPVGLHVEELDALVVPSRPQVDLAGSNSVSPDLVFGRGHRRVIRGHCGTVPLGGLAQCQRTERVVPQPRTTSPTTPTREDRSSRRTAWCWRSPSPRNLRTPISASLPKAPCSPVSWASPQACTACGGSSRVQQLSPAHADPHKASTVLAPTDGEDSVTLTLQPSLQRLAQAELMGRDGSVVGSRQDLALLALYSNPTPTTPRHSPRLPKVPRVRVGRRTTPKTSTAIRHWDSSPPSRRSFPASRSRS